VLHPPVESAVGSGRNFYVTLASATGLGFPLGMSAGKLTFADLGIFPSVSFQRRMGISAPGQIRPLTPLLYCGRSLGPTTQ